MDSTGTFTYDSSLPTPRDRMRHTLGDTNPSAPLRWDETYDAALVYYENDETLATAKLARALASQFGRNPTSVSVPGGPSVSFSDRVRTWLDTAQALEKAAKETSLSGAYRGEQGYRPGMTGDTATSEYRRGWDDAPPETDW